MLDFSNASWDFQPVTRSVYDTEGRRIDGYIEVINGDTGAHLGLHSAGYKPVPNRQVVDQFESAIRKANISDDYTFKVKDVDSGKRLEINVEFPGVTIQPKVGDITCYQAFGRNSFDATWPLSTNVMGKRLVCLNGMVLPGTLGSLTQKHTKNLNIEAVGGRMKNALTHFLGLENEYRHLAEVGILDHQASNVFKALCPAPKAKCGADWNKTQVELLETYYTGERKMLGRNMWALLNSITYWSTHTGGYKNPEVTRASREAQVSKLLAGPVWNSLR